MSQTHPIYQTGSWAGAGGVDMLYSRLPAEMETPVTEQHVLVEVKDGIGTIIFNRSAALNVLSPQMTDGLIEATARFERDADVRCVVIRGAGEHFMAGGDV